LANQRKQRRFFVNPDGSEVEIFEQNVILGLSMGGLVARYALADMEKQRRVNPIASNQHETRLLITHDSPHKGANTPLGLQCMLQSLANFGINFTANATAGLSVLFKDFIPPIVQYERFLNAPANEQLAIYRALGVGGGNLNFLFTSNTFLENEYRTMITFPANEPPPYKMVASSNGSECGSGIFTPYSEIIRREGNFFLGPAIISQQRWSTQLIVNALPAAGQSRRIYQGRLQTSYRILGVININITLWQNSANNPTFTLPIDGAAGGLFRILGTQQTIDNNQSLNLGVLGFSSTNLTRTRFCFVPVSSGLDVTENLSTQVLNKSYYVGMTNPSSRFENYITSPINGSILFNEAHIQFTERNTNWMFNEMENLNAPNITNCAYLCQNPQIVGAGGANSVCTNWTTFRINPTLPLGATVRWGATPFGSVDIESPNSAVTRIRANANSGTEVTLHIDIDGDCGPILRIFRSMTIGIPLITTTIDNKPITTTPTALCTNRGYVFTATDGSTDTNFTWSLDNPNPYVSLSNTTGATCTVAATQPTSFLLTVTKATNCGTGARNMPILMNTTCVEPFRIFPNPTPIAIAVATDNFDIVYSMQIIDKFGVVQKEITESTLKSNNTWGNNTKEVKFDLSNLEKGVYFLHIITHQGTHKYQIVKE
jgi:hypothetical protein